MIDVVVVSPFAPTTAWVWDSGATAATPSIARIASASSVVSVELAPPFAPAAVIVSRFVPRLDRRSVMLEVVPCPTPTRATTDATPMITPSIVRAARSRPVRRRENARRTSSRILMPTEPPVADVHLAAGRCGDLGVVGDEDDRAARPVELAEQLEDLAARGLVEVAGRLVGEDERGVGDEGAGDGDALLLAAGELGRLVGRPGRRGRGARAPRSPDASARARPTPW